MHILWVFSEWTLSFLKSVYAVTSKYKLGIQAHSQCINAF